MSQSEPKAGFLNSLQSKLGMDVTVGLSLPIWVHEPTTTVSRMAEMLNFANLLEEVFWTILLTYRLPNVRTLWMNFCM